MTVSKDRRREIDAHAAAWATELIEDYGADADRVMLSCLQHPGYGAAERYCFRRVRVALRGCGIPAARDPNRLGVRIVTILTALVTLATNRARLALRISRPAARQASRSGA